MKQFLLLIPFFFLSLILVKLVLGLVPGEFTRLADATMEPAYSQDSILHVEERDLYGPGDVIVYASGEGTGIGRIVGDDGATVTVMGDGSPVGVFTSYESITGAVTGAYPAGLLGFLVYGAAALMSFGGLFVWRNHYEKQGKKRPLRR